MSSSTVYKRYQKKPIFEKGNVRAAMQVIPMMLPVTLIAGGVIGLVVGAAVALCSTTVAGIAAAPLWGIGTGAGIGLLGPAALYLAGEAKNVVSNIIGGARNMAHDAWCFIRGKKNDKQPAAPAAAAASYDVASEDWKAAFQAWQLEHDKLSGSFSAAQGKPAVLNPTNAPAPKGPVNKP